MSEHYNASNANLEAYGLSVTGQVRKANEDSCGFSTVPNGDLFVVCDGMGGHVGGATASKIAVEQIIQHFKAQHYDDVYQALADALCRANIQILGEAAANPSLKGMGTTACIVLVSGNDAYIAHVGDSRIYLYEAAKKRLYRITKDHSLVQALVDQGQLDDRDAEHHPQKNVIMKALGTKEELKPDVYTCPVQPASGDIFLICSDGLSGMIDDNDIEAILSSDASIQEKTDQLVANANVPGKGLDNITAQLIKVINSPYPSSNHPDHNPRWRKEMFGEVTQPPTSALNTQPVTPQPKKRMSPKVLALIIVGALLVLGGLGFLLNMGTKPDLRAKIDQIKSDTTTLGNEIRKLNKDSLELQQSLLNENDSIKKLYTKTVIQLKEKKSKYKDLKKQLQDLNNQLEEQDTIATNKGKGLFGWWSFGRRGNNQNDTPGDNPTVKPSANTGGESGGGTGGGTGEATGGREIEGQQFTITAKISSMQYGTIRWDVDDQQGTSIQGAIQNGTEITLTAEPNEGFDFINWTVNDTEVSTNANFTLTVTADSTLFANFKPKEDGNPNTFTITLLANPKEGGTVSGGGQYDKGKTCTICAKSKKGYIFDGWKENNKDVPGDSICSFTIKGNRTLVANFKKVGESKKDKKFTVKVTCEPSDGGTVEGVRESYKQGETCNLTARPTPGNKISYWEDNGEKVAGTPKIHGFKVDKDHIIIVHFVEDKVKEGNPEEPKVIPNKPRKDTIHN